MSAAVDSGRVPPHDIEAEESLIGAMLLNPAAIAAGRLLDPADFYNPAHATIHGIVVDLADKGDTVDAVTVAAELRRLGLEEIVGGRHVLTDLMSRTPSTGGAARYAEIVAQSAQARRFIGLGRQLQDAGYARNADAAALIIDAIRGDTRRADTLDSEDVAAVMRGEVAPLTPTMLRRSDGNCLMYPGLLHWLMGEPGKGKTMVALHVVAEQLAAGGTVLFIDYEGNRRVVGSRLAALGVDAATVDAQFIYVRPNVIDRQWAAQAVATVAGRYVDLVVIDGVAKAMGRQGLNEDKAADAIAWLDLIVNPLTNAGAAVLLLDHVTKSTEGRAGWARGSGAKIGEVSGAAWMLKPVIGFNRTKPGRADLIQAKDREGFNGVDGDTVARIMFTPNPEAGTLRIAVLAPEADAGPFEPTGLMEQISKQLEPLTEPASKRSVRTLVKGKNDYKDLALERLTQGGYLAIVKGGYRSVRPYRKPADDGDPGPTPPTDEEHDG